MTGAGGKAPRGNLTYARRYGDPKAIQLMRSARRATDRATKST